MFRNSPKPSSLPPSQPISHLSKMVTKGSADFRLFDQTFFSSIISAAPDLPKSVDYQFLLQQLQPIFHFIADLHAAAPSKSFFGSSILDTNRQATITEFAHRFALYVRATEDAIIRTEEQVAIIPNRSEHFREGWQQRLRSARYLAFVTHYGQYRKGEVDTDGVGPLPYVWHPFRAEADILPESFGLLAEETSSATVLHDSLEDIEKSFLVTKCGFSLKEAREKILHFVSAAIQPKSKHAVSISQLLYAVDNQRAVEILGRKPMNRTEKMMCRLYHLSRMSERDFERLFPHVFAISASDRLQNGKTIETHNPTRFAAIWLETSFVYPWLTEYFSMPNCTESLRDLLQSVNADERTKRESSRDMHEQVHQLPSKFCEVIFSEIERVGFSREDLHIHFRSRGMRFLDPKSQPDQLLASEDSADHGIAFNNFVNFIPSCRDASKNPQLVKVLRSLIQRLFPRTIDGIFDEQKTDFGKHYQYRSDLPETAVSLQDLPPDEQRFGYVVTRIFDDSADYIRSYLGNLHAAFHLQDKTARKKLLRLQNVFRTYVDGPLRVLLFTDVHSEQPIAIERPSSISSRMRKRIKMIMRSEQFVRPSKPFTFNEQQILRKIAHTFFYLFFGFHKDQVQLINKKENPNAHIPSFAPKGMPISSALIMHDIEALFRMPLFAEVDSDPREGTTPVWDKEDFASASQSDDFSRSPFGVGLEGGVLTYEVDRSVSDHRLAFFLDHFCKKMLQCGLEKFVKEGHIQGDVPKQVSEIGLET